MLARRLVAIALLFSITAEAQDAIKPIDWTATFKELTSTNHSIHDKTWDDVTEVLVPRVCKEEAALASNDVAGLVSVFESERDPIRLDASGTTMVLAGCRADSAETLSALLPTIIKHANDLTPRIRRNSIATLTYLQPDIPSAALETLIKVAAGDDESLAVLAPKGFARMANSSAVAADALERALVQRKSIPLQVAAIQAVSLGHLTDRRFVSILGDLLNDTNQQTIRETLFTLGNLGPQAISANRERLSSVASKFEHTELGNIALQLLARE